MADREKLQRLKAAKKKVKEHKLKMQKGSNQKDEIIETPTLFNADSLTSSVHSNEGSMLEDDAVSKVNDSQLINYFSATTNHVVDPIAFFDTLPSNQNTANDVLNEPLINFNQNNDPGCIEYPELNPHEIYDKLINEVPQETICSKVVEDVKDTQITYDNVESLRQISSQMTQLVNSNTEFDVNDFTNDLEKRNQELAHLLSTEKLKTEQLNNDIETYKTKVNKLEEESRLQKDEFDRRMSAELGPLREQLQTHMQTVGILVGEKSELSASLSQSQLMLKQKANENEELNGRLKTSRSRVADLEKELNNLRLEINRQNDKIGNDNNEILKYENLKRQKEEADQDISELREKLTASINDNMTLQKDVQETKAQLQLADIKIQQLTAGESIQADTQIENLTQEKLLLEKHLVALNQTLKTITQERDQASHQYQQYVQQLNGQLSVLAQKLETVTQDNETLSKREQDLVKHISELERHLQNLQNEHVYSTNNHLKNDVKNVVESLENLKIEKIKLEENFEEIRNERDELLKELLEKKNIIEEMEGTIERLQGGQPDNAKLLATIESDKVAAARAVSQNKQLKDQLEEMQKAFIKMSNDKMELTEQLETEKHQNKDLIEKLQHTETQLFKLAEAIEIKDRELTEIRNESSVNDKYSIQVTQLEDRLRHYEAQENSFHTLQNELKDARQQIDLLVAENLEFKQTYHNNVKNASECDVNDSTINEICNENDTPIEEESFVDNNNKIVLNSINKELAMKRLEEKFTKTMDDIANLQDEKQSLEHLVLQLQCETETIGEYIMLYQHQRAVLKQRAIEKEEQLKRLAADREEMRNKLEKLNSLIETLMIEKNDVPVDILEQHRNMQKENLCLEHAKIQEEMINKVNGTNEIKESPKETAEKIIALLSEIKTSNLVQADENFHPCPWCSGQLINI